jgi:cyclic pyranopterin phosphate synthase
MVTTFKDAFGRTIDYLRVSVTDRCNLRCMYCMPPEGVPPLAHDDILRFEELLRVVQAATALGVTRLRLTGGEPLVRRGIVELIGLLRQLPALQEITITTNGILLAPLAEALKAAGLDRVNVSLDTLDAERYRAITRGGELASVLAGICAAQAAGLEPVKVNMVVMRGVNDHETLAMAQQSVAQCWHVRYIEMMPLGAAQRVCTPDEAHPDQTLDAGLVSNDQVRQQIEAHYGPLEPADVNGSGPAETWRVPGSAGSIGFISAVSHGFCAGCNRLRLTATGRLVPCLFSDRELDLRPALRRGATQEELQALLLEAVALKGSGHRLAEHILDTSHQMSRIGG